MASEPLERKRRRAERRGHTAEYWAALYLMLKGYRILAIRYRTRLGEIDLVARKKNVVAIIEVKARRSVNGAVDAVGWHSQQRIRAAADIWLSRRKDFSELSVRFDIVAVMPRRLPRHFVDAF
ncbi:YraN family protein [Agrobacterium sp. NPDC090273]|jgi:putative endonuclease|uniref:YraN family protein n=1 Tax=Agrobacterium TaxID=357 RepID=UPI0021D03A9A|nr:YraN family protein [Agrobacterium tumefaciens]UXS02941.1 YraN family protein [Agrobacterium tumefaciens]